MKEMKKKSCFTKLKIGHFKYTLVYLYSLVILGSILGCAEINEKLQTFKWE